MRMTLTIRTTEDGKVLLYHQKRSWVFNDNDEGVAQLGKFVAELANEALEPVRPFVVTVEHPSTGDALQLRVIAPNGDAAQRSARLQVAGSVRGFQPEHLTITDIQEEVSGWPADTN